MSHISIFWKITCNLEVLSNAFKKKKKNGTLLEIECQALVTNKFVSTRISYKNNIK